MPSNRRKKNKARAQRKKQSNSRTSTRRSDFFGHFLEVNSPFVVSSRTGQPNLRRYFPAETIHKVSVIPTKFLQYWEFSDGQRSISSEQLALKFVEFCDELRPDALPHFEPLFLLDHARFAVDGECAFLGYSVLRVLAL